MSASLTAFADADEPSAAGNAIEVSELIDEVLAIARSGRLLRRVVEEDSNHVKGNADRVVAAMGQIICGLDFGVRELRTNPNLSTSRSETKTAPNPHGIGASLC
jgi:hypothetical protein